MILKHKMCTGIDMGI